MNIDYSEINKFEAISADWWNPYGKFQPLHAINPLRLGFIEQHTPLTGKKILDVGCGGGILAEGMAQQGAEVLGIDLGENALAAARQHAAKQGLLMNYQYSTVEALASSQPNTFDVVTCMEMLEHVPDPVSVVQSCAALVKPGGYVFFSTLNRNAKAYLFAIIGAEYFLKLMPKGTHDYKKFIRPAELVNWARIHQLLPIKMSGLEYNPLNRRYKLSNDVEVNYLLCCQKC